MRNLRLLLVSSLLLLLLGPISCQQARDVLAGLTKPRVSLAGVRLADLSLSGAVLDLDLEIENPYSVSLPVTGLRYRLLSGGREFLSGGSSAQQLIDPGATGHYPVAVALDFADVLGTLREVRLGSVVPYSLDLGLFVDAPAAGRLELPVSHQGEMPVPAPPSVRVASLDVGRATLGGVEGALRLDVGNTNDFPFDLKALGFDLVLGGVSVGRLSLDRQTHFPAGGEQQFTMPLSLSTVNAGTALLRILGGSEATWSLDGRLQAGTPFGPLTLPFGEQGRTDIHALRR